MGVMNNQCRGAIARQWRAFDLVAAMLCSGLASVCQAQMTIPGQFAVAPSGAATYSIPIQVPSGVAGVEPKLALTYNSQAGAGLLGLGWSLSGLSIISRCPQTVLQDGVSIPGAVNYDLNDRYCLDGQRLIASVQGSDGANGAEYRTELDGYSKITSYAETGATNGPGSFIVRTKSGLIMEYGKTEDSRIEAQGRVDASGHGVVVAWGVSKVTDARGNYYTVTYTEDNTTGQFYPKRIDYTGNASATPEVVATNTVYFDYEPRPDVVPTYHAGSLSKSTVRLKKISTTAGVPISASSTSASANLIAYTINYDTAATPRVASVGMCSVTGSCLPLQSFAWSSISTGWAALAVWGAGNSAGTSVGNTCMQGDFNGDGKADITCYTGMSGNWATQLSTGNGWSLTTWSGGNNPGTSVGDRCMSGDFNGDGRTDITCYTGTGGNWATQLSTGNGWSLATWSGGAGPGVPIGNQCMSGDFNGDGRTDIACYTGAGGNWAIQLSTGSGWSSFTWSGGNNPGSSVGDRCMGADFNGDGKTDITCYTGTGGNWATQLSTGNGWSLATWGGGAGPGVPIGNQCMSGDFNGDGKTDIACYTGAAGNWAIQLSTGTGWSSFTWSGGNNPGTSVGDRCMSGDFNRDGRTDITCYTGASGNWATQMSTGSGWTLATWAGGVGPGIPVGNQCMSGDFNGDGRTDIACYGGSGSNWAISMAVGDNPGWMLATNNGLTAGIQSIAYKSLPQALGVSYRSDLTVSLPKTNAVIPVEVVTGVVQSSGVGGGRTTSYSYGNWLSEGGFNGRGSLGFQWVQNQDVSTGLVSRTCYRQDWPYIGMVDKTFAASSDVGLPACGAIVGYNDLSALTVSGSNLLSLTINAYKFNSYANTDAVYASPTLCADDPATGRTSVSCPAAATQAGKHYQIYAFQSLTQSRDWDGSTFIALPATRTTMTQDNLGNATQVRAETLNVDGVTASGYSKTTTNTYLAPDTANWLLGRLQKSSVQVASP
jgi:hypothetical protein